MDNIFIERVWGTVKYEEIYLNDYETTQELRKALRKYFHFYNTERPHQTFDGATPLEVYQQSIGSAQENRKLESAGPRAAVNDSDCTGSNQAEACGLSEQQKGCIPPGAPTQEKYILNY